ncbi:MAG: iron-containing alcohol dehydrogenase [Pollutimonas bauzanensis]|uniref:Alcohol dehydrogenase, class IV n=1 Tax=Pollutimonas bauzanensis TaxID=658167 RepID=A0A1M5Y6S6_9BURK|nr:iron-containing alcohol dehydrogenase [Pollutimonas bauzanensis]SHI07757.1 Alcohol dehydrogenase, class IV [Pollutimonas bauzanensis]
MTTLLFGTPVLFDHGARRALPAELARAGVKRPLFVTDKGVMAAGVFGQAIEALPDAAGFPVFSEVPVNPTEAAALAGAAMYREQHCDGVIGIGGGAALDLAKAVAILAVNAPPLWDYCNRHAAAKDIRNCPPLILMPTTAGTGSEVGRSAVIVFDNGIKAGVRCPEIVTMAICDPDLTFALPPSISATTGMDALAHCIETFCSPAINPPADAIALDGMKRIFDHIERAVSDGRDAAARWNMMMGSVEGAMCFQKGMGAVHALSHPLGALGYHHGTLNAVLLPHVLACNLDALGGKADRMAQQAGLASGRQLPEAVARLTAAIHIPPRLRDLGLTRADLGPIAGSALQDNAHKTNPRPLQGRDYDAILLAAF